MVFEFTVQAGKQSGLSVNLHVLAVGLSGPCEMLPSHKPQGSAH